MVQTAVFKARLCEVGVQEFTCRFCSTSDKSYSELLCHELVAHACQFTCKGCDGPIARLLQHLRGGHGGDGVDQGASATGPEPSVGKAATETCEVGTQTEVVYGTIEQTESDSSPPSPVGTEHGSIHDVEDERAEEGGGESRLAGADWQFFDASDGGGNGWNHSGRGSNIFDIPGLPDSSPLPSGEDESSDEEAPEGALTRTELRELLAVIESRKTFGLGELTKTRTHPRNLSSDAVSAILDDMDTCERAITRLGKPRMVYYLERDAEEELEPDFADKRGPVADWDDERAACLGAMFVRDLYGKTRCEPLRREARGSAPRDPFLCYHCPLSFETKAALLRHINCVHEDISETPFKCLRCRKFYQRRGAFLRHAIWSRLGKTVPCHFSRRCYELFASVAERNRHSFEVHGPPSCKICGARFKRAETLKYHLLRDHAEPLKEQTLVCKICCIATFDASFRLYKHELLCRRLFNDHQRSGGAIPWPLKTRRYRGRKKGSKNKAPRSDKGWPRTRTCNQFSPGDEDGAEAHLPDGGGGLHTCGVCSEVFARLADCEAHAETHVQDRERLAALALEQRRVLVRHYCGHCPKSFMTRIMYRNHLVNVHGEKRRSCDGCGSVYVASELKLAFSEVGELFYRCAQCEESPYRSLTLRELCL